MTTFTERKTARIAAGNVNYKFNVVARSYPRIDQPILATFKSRREAENFAFKQIGLLVGYTPAAKAFCAAWHKTHKNELRPQVRFVVEREAE